MALRNIRHEGDPILRKTSRPVKEVNERMTLLLDDMLETMYESNGVGLAAPQIGILRRLIVVDVGQGPYKMVNPEIIETSDEEQLDVEGCLSVPNFNGSVYRPEKIKVSYTDENGEDKEIEAEGLFARCICHEIDHLDGILFRDRVDKVIDYNNLTEDMEEYLDDHHLANPNKSNDKETVNDPAADGDEIRVEDEA